MENGQSCVVGLDVGHSSVKIVCDTQTGSSHLFFPSITIPAMSLDDDHEAERAKSDTVTINGVDYFIGETAKVQSSRALGDISENWLNSTGYLALIAGAMKKIAMLGAKPNMIVAGLPTSLYKTQRDQLRLVMKQVIENNIEIKIVPQPFGAYQFNTLDEKGRPLPNRSFTKESWGVVDVGYFSTDFMVMRGYENECRWIQSASGICSGIHLAASRLVKLVADEVRVNGKHVTITSRDAEQALQTGCIRFYGEVNVSEQVRKASMTILDEIDRAATQYIESEASTLNGIILAGGGAPLIYSAIKERWPHAVMANNPRFAVAEGFYRFGKGVLRTRQSLVSK